MINNLAHVLSDLGRNEVALALVTQAAAGEGSPFAAALRETRALILQRLGRER